MPKDRQSWKGSANHIDKGVLNDSFRFKRI